MKYWILLTFVFTNILFSQDEVLISKSSRIHFFSSTPLEDIYAVNTQAKGTLHTSDHKVTVLIPIKEFQFEKSIMKEHFNEDYMESDKYPYATFRGKIHHHLHKFNLHKDGTYHITVDGELNIHGVHHPRKIDCTVLVENGKIAINAKFSVKLVDHHIKKPSLVFDKIADEIGIDVVMEFVKQTPNNTENK